MPHLRSFLALVVFQVFITLPSTFALNCTSCFTNDTINLSCNPQIAVINLLYTAPSSVPYYFNSSHLWILTSYSLTPIINAQTFMCGPVTRYKAFSVFTPSILAPPLNQTTRLTYIVNKIDNINLTDPPLVDLLLPKVFLEVSNPANFSFTTQINFTSVLPNDCTKLGDFYQYFPLNKTYLNILENNKFSSTNLGCSISSLDCGYKIRSVYNSDCCFINGTKFDVDTCVLTSQDYTMTNCTCVIKPVEKFLTDWILGVSITGPILFLIIISLLIALCCCVPGAKYIRA